MHEPLLAHNGVQKKALKNQGAPSGEALQNDGGLLGFAV